MTLALTGVSLSNASGALLLTPAGVAGQLRGTIAVTIPGVSFGGTFSVGVNTTAAPVSRTFDVGGDEVALNLPAGPYLRVEGTAVTLNVLGQQLSGDFAVERTTLADGSSRPRSPRATSPSRSAPARARVTLTDGTGAFLVTTAGIAGQLSGRIALTLPAGISFSGNFSLALNNTSAAVDQTFAVGGESLRPEPAGRPVPAHRGHERPGRPPRAAGQRRLQLRARAVARRRSRAGRDERGRRHDDHPHRRREPHLLARRRRQRQQRLRRVLRHRCGNRRRAPGDRRAERPGRLVLRRAEGAVQDDDAGRSTRRSRSARRRSA